MLKKYSKKYIPQIIFPLYIYILNIAFIFNFRVHFCRMAI